MSEQHFEVKEERFGREESVTVYTWLGDSNKSGINVYTKNLRKLRDTLNEYLGDTCDCDEEIR